MNVQEPFHWINRGKYWHDEMFNEIFHCHIWLPRAPVSSWYQSPFWDKNWLLFAFDDSSIAGLMIRQNRSISFPFTSHLAYFNSSDEKVGNKKLKSHVPVNSDDRFVLWLPIAVPMGVKFQPIIIITLDIDDVLIETDVWRCVREYLRSNWLINVGFTSRRRDHESISSSTFFQSCSTEFRSRVWKKSNQTFDLWSRERKKINQCWLLHFAENYSGISFVS